MDTGERAKCEDGYTIDRAMVEIIETYSEGNIRLNCAQIVPAKVKYFQTVPNETKNSLKI
ncbi:hypothetical protein D1AOALGA4SA_9585 [Olavius algarvensis Delta 1 endosymbiont]|nr:hypothetical protein D1AOALGA4SA_9585 [Olavius algarvensis Delta 1 endosymbiont]